MNQFYYMKPYDLGETRVPEALPHLVTFLENGQDDDKRLAASGITKLIDAGVDCQKALPSLLKNIYNGKPQVRQYTLKALLKLNLEENLYPTFVHLYRREGKEYNRDLILKLLMNFSCFNEFDLEQMFVAESQLQKEIEDVEVPVPEVSNTEKGYVYFLQEELTGKVKIGKTTDIDERMKDFGVKLPFPVRLLHVIDTNNQSYTERLFHVYFDEKRVSGEWFNLSNEELEWIVNGEYTPRIKYSITFTKGSTPKRSQVVPITKNQMTFLSSLLEEKGFILNKPIIRLSIEEAAHLISHLHKGQFLDPEMGTFLEKRG